MLGLSISTLRSYHFRVLIVPMFVLAIQGLARVGKQGIGLGCLWIGLVIIHRIEPVSWYNDVEQADAVANSTLSALGCIWLEGFGAELTVSPRSVGVAMVVQGCDVTIAHRPTDQIWLIHRVDEQHDLPDGTVIWTGKSHRLRMLSLQEWNHVSDTYKWSGHDVVSLFMSEDRIELQ